MQLRLVTALVMLSAPLAGAQARDTVIIRQPVPVYGFKDGAAATLFSVLLPGGGQMYAGRGGKGVVIFATSTASVIAYGNAQGRCHTGNSCGHGWLLAGVGSWLYGVLSASSDAEEYNLRRRRRLNASAGITSSGAVSVQVTWQPVLPQE